MKKILFISLNQYGYNTDLYNYSKYLTDEYKVSYLCMDTYLPRVSSENVNVDYINNPRKRTNLRYKLLLKSVNYIRNINPDIIFMKYFAGCSLIRLIYPKKKILLDIRTATIDSNKKIRKKKDTILSLESGFFKYISVISNGLIDILRLNIIKTFVLPLGADKMINFRIKDKKMYLLYIGILDNRKIEDTILGFELFYHKYKNIIPCKYTIIGYGDKKEYEEIITNLIKERCLQGVVSFLGRKKHDELKPFIIDNNIGVSYVPISTYYQHQPPTKTYEYIQNGLICIATNTFENRKVINKNNGILINDNVEDFFHGLEKIYNNFDEYDPLVIINESEQYSWFNIVKNILKPNLRDILYEIEEQ